MASTFIAYLDSVKARDPAARSRWEILLYPGVLALGLHRVAHWLFGGKLYFLARLVNHLSRALTAIDIICDAILRWLAPVLSFTCEEAWRMYRPDAEPSVHLTLFPEGFDQFRDDALAVGHVLEDLARNHDVGRLVGQRQRMRISLNRHHSMPRRQQQTGLNDIDANVPVAVDVRSEEAATAADVN